MPLSSKDNPNSPSQEDAVSDKKEQDLKYPDAPGASQDPEITDQPDLDPTKVVGTYAMQPDPNADRPAPQPAVPEGVHKAPKDDEPGAPAIGKSPV